MLARQLGLDEKTIMILIGLVVAIFILITTSLIMGNDSLPVLGACFAGPIVFLRGFAYLKTGERKKGAIQMASGAFILAVLAVWLLGYL